MFRGCKALMLAAGLLLAPSGPVSVAVGANGSALVQVQARPIMRLMPIGQWGALQRATIIAARLNRLRSDGRLRANPLTMRAVRGEWVLFSGNVGIATADPQTAAAMHLTTLGLAQRWQENLVRAFGLARLVSRPVPSFDGLASWYGASFAGQTMADGRVFNPGRMTAASPWLPFGAQVRVTDLRTGKSVTVSITDRGPFVGGRVLDLSQAAAIQIGLTGVDPVRAEVTRG